MVFSGMDLSSSENKTEAFIVQYLDFLILIISET